jgi:uncharacterized protein (TIRG00374 family)
MNKRIYSILQYVIFLGGGLFLVWWQLKSMSDEETNEFYNAIKGANYWIIIPIAIMSILSHVSRSMRWKLLMEPLGYKPKLSNLFLVTMIGYLANAAIPRLGELLKCTFLAKYENLKVDKLVGTIIVERSIDFFCYLIFIGLTIAIQINLIGDFFEQKLKSLSTKNKGPFFLKIAIFSFSILVIFQVLKLLYKKYPNNNFIKKIIASIQGIWEGFKSIKKLKNRRQFILHTIFIWAMYLGQIYLGFRGMNGTDALGINAAFSVLTLATLSMIVTPGGIGSFPIFVMQTLLIYGINAPLGKAFGWIMWGVSTSIIIVVGLCCLIILPYLNKKNISKEIANL